MRKIIYAAITIIWILDICNINVPGLEFILNDSNGFNGLFWFLIGVFIPECSVTKSNKEDK